MKKFKYIILIIIIILTLLVIVYKNENKFDKLYNSTVYIEGFSDIESNIGSGIVYKIKNNSAYIITSYHIVESYDNLKVCNKNNDCQSANIYYFNSNNDIALLKINNTLDLSVAKFSTSKMNVKDRVYALGMILDNYPYTLTSGIISYTDRKIEINNIIFNTIQVDIPINSGNSGGPLINEDGYVIGMIFVKESNLNGISFAIPINDIIKEIKDKI